MTPINDTRCTLGEGPLWHPERAEFFWFDIIGCKLHSLAKTWEFDEMVSAAGWIDRATMLIASETRLFVFDLETGHQRDLSPLEADMPHTRSNDGRADPQGGFWIGTMGKRAEKGAGSIWRWYRGELRKLFDEISIPNAISFAPDGRSACFTDTVTQQVMRVALDAQGWPAAPAECWLDLRGTPYKPDGAVFDAGGNFWLAQWGAGRVAAYAPNGDFLRAVSFSAAHTSCPAFGGPDLTDLYCTTAREGLARPTPLDGATFCLRDVGKGLQEACVRLPD